jgi:hypothetical protein
MRAVLVALSVVAAASPALADGVDRAPLRGSAVADAPAYQVDFGARAYPAAPVAVVPPPVPGPAPFTYEVGGRYWVSFGKLSKSLFDIPESSAGMVSRLTYSGLTGQSGEVYGRMDHVSGLMLKGYVGLGVLNKGSLNDEDFAPFINPYSSTLSDQHDGRLGYATVDLGYAFWRTPQMGIAGFVGYNFLSEKVNASGCTQIATNPFVCVPVIPTSVLGITEDAQFHSVRLGLTGEARLFDRLKLTAEAAWLPFTSAQATDAHWLRIGTTPGDFSGAIPESGHGQGVQLEAALAYQATANWSFGLGARYWRLDTTGISDFTHAVVGFNGGQQPLDFTTERYGLFLQGGYKL